ncbi:MAG: family N-acetyltransferase [Daejeonella sp.]|nr:family N-acetyltransferase [Daejeonella sp.]
MTIWAYPKRVGLSVPIFLPLSPFDSAQGDKGKKDFHFNPLRKTVIAKNMNEIKIANTDAEILKCLDVLLALRPHLQKENFVETVQEIINDGYQLAFIEENGRAISAIGYRYLNFLYNGKHIYIDDLSSLPEARGKGHAGKLLDFVIETAQSKGYKFVTLDSGYARNDAHRLYLNKGFILSAHHFSKSLIPSPSPGGEGSCSVINRLRSR